jgi:hypothetical protein
MHNLTILPYSPEFCLVNGTSYFGSMTFAWAQCLPSVWQGDDITGNLVIQLAGNSSSSHLCIQNQVGLYVKCPLLSDQNKKSNVLANFSKTHQHKIS